MDCSLPDSSVHGILQARILEWVPVPFSRGCSWPRNWTRVYCITGRFFTSWATREAHNWHITMHECRAYNVLIWYIHMKVKVTQSCPTLCNPTDSTVHGILQARILEWVGIPFSSRSSQPRNRTGVSCIEGGLFTSWAIREALLNLKVILNLYCPLSQSLHKWSHFSP